MVVKRALALGMFALAAAAAAAFVALSASENAPTAVAHCRAAFGSLTNGVCLDEPSAAPAPNGTPAFGVGPTGEGPGISSSPLFPGQTIGGPIGP